MGSPWGTLLFRPTDTVTAITQDDETPVLVLVPVLAGIAVVFAWTATAHQLLLPVTQIAAALLFGPPLALLTSWLGRLCLTGVSRLLGRAAPRGAMICVIAWSWLPLLYLSLLALPFSRLNKGAELLLVLQALGIVWQLTITAVALRRLLSFTRLRTISLVLMSFVLYLAIVLAVGYGLSALTGDWFKMAGVL